MAIWVTSDLHFNHKNIIQLCRPQFESIEQHNQTIVDRYNEVVGKDDLVYILGDVGFTPASALSEWVQKLNGRKILLIGNHDKLTDGEYRKMGFIEVVRHPIYFSTRVILSHCPVQEAYNNPYVFNVHGHIHKGSLMLPNYININTELRNFYPVDLKKIDETIASTNPPNRYQRYGTEWYADWEKHIETT